MAVTDTYDEAARNTAVAGSASDSIGWTNKQRTRVLGSVDGKRPFVAADTTASGSAQVIENEKATGSAALPA